jgi:hypothetical protein
MPGLDSTVMSSGSEQLAFCTAIARSMVGVRPRDVMIMSAVPVDVRMVLNQVDITSTKSEVSASRALLAGTSVTWNVSVSTTRLDKIGASYTTLTSGLQTAMDTGSFLTTLKSASKSFNVVTTTTLKVNPAMKIQVSKPTAAPTASPTIIAIIPSITLDVISFGTTDVTISISLKKDKIVETDISGIRN